MAEKKPEKKEVRAPKVRDADSDQNQSTLFVRNIAWDVTQP